MIMEALLDARNRFNNFIIGVLYTDLDTLRGEKIGGEVFYLEVENEVPCGKPCRVLLDTNNGILHTTDGKTFGFAELEDHILVSEIGITGFGKYAQIRVMQVIPGEVTSKTDGELRIVPAITGLKDGWNDAIYNSETKEITI